MLTSAHNKQLGAAPESKDAPLKPEVIRPGHCPACDGRLVAKLVPIGGAAGTPTLSLMAWCQACDRAAIP
jgi:hypothetical protein